MIFSFMMNRFCKSLILVLVELILVQANFAQKTNSKDYDALKSAYIDFKNKNYENAYTYFQRMYEQYPKDPAYNYYTGVCLLFLDNNPEKALKRLRIAATKDVPEDVYFYLGLAYHKSYLFNDALKNFERFKEKASKNEIRDYDIQNHINMLNNTLLLTGSIREPVVYSRESSDITHFYELYRVNGLDGKFGNMFQFLNHSKDSLNHESIMFIPNKTERNEVVYFSLKNEKRGDMDIFRSTRKNDGTWSEPENLGDIINSPFDDSYPYIHTDGSTLYFATKGHFSMGGYDIYKTIWNWEKQQWSEPVNLGFPVNSPFDDFLFVPSPDDKFAYFTSSRYTNKNLSVIKIKYPFDNKTIENIPYNELVSLSQLNVSEIVKKEMNQEQTVKVKNELNEIVKIKNKESFLYKSEYDSLLNQAMKFQLKADSLQWVADNKRQLLENTHFEPDRLTLTNEIIKLEEEIYLAQKTAENTYKRVREVEQINLARENVSYETEQRDKEPVQNNESQNKSELVSIKQTKNDSLALSRLEIPEPDKSEQLVNGIDPGFYIKTPSIYNEKNPIPVNEKLPDGVIYMIQLGAYSTSKNPSSFLGFTPLTAIKKDGSNIKKYYTGKFLKLKEAELSLPKIKGNGFKDAYIVAFKNGKIIPVNEAVKFESIKDENSFNAENKDELKIKYVIKFELNKSDSLTLVNIKIQLPMDKKINTEIKGNIIFTHVESFNNFDEAYAVKKKLESIIENEIEIHAFFANSRIPVDQARKMTQ
ncbi:MAG: hypothetical protein A2X13_14070 [Bacteroidetes bacterium GWC2_33_15]|nr:MAG: hypothetical protein A2X10_09285 [Bacteroidetes bacterium GWA2_33_15]OFX50467.1 MAG: hypothetical protein A2X13_14070 [Bacteroidetes bacterium GWC2_33_15]OFX66615.1 MAG: hypothetical protein A2X15_07805 [Bacteroidetes bacterium GWB2_32_14]OFX69233.1 MAG: hypothetical protein A2X14_08735 [Bacteroidetes bacterium GWD2_33_33]HAN18544.1 hypothetical protein [Bacteroidales bacterium]